MNSDSHSTTVISSVVKPSDEPPEMPDDVARVLDTYPIAARRRLLLIRKLILETAAETQGVGPLTETLKWGEPAYLTQQTKAGSTIRIGLKKDSTEHVGLYFNCNTTLVDKFRCQYGDQFIFEDNRAIVLPLKGQLPTKPLCDCIAQGLTYHLGKARV